jgi:hypothetical protein
MNGLSASQELRVRYWMTAGTGNWLERYLGVTPIRVS